MSFTKIQYVDNETIITAENLNTIQEAILSIDNIYPVGSIYMSLQSNSPASFIGGTWEQIMNNFLVGAGDSYEYGTTGGSLTHTHTTGNCTLTVAQMPSHAHNPSNYNTAGSDTSYKRQFTTNLHTSSDSVARAKVASSSSSTYYAMTATTYSDITSVDSTSRVGGGQAHNHGNTGSSSNLPPYLAVYMWKRIE